MIRKSLRVFIGLIAAIMLSVSFASVAAAAEPVSILEYQKGVGIRCNKERETKKLAKLALDTSLCEIALKLAMEQEGYTGESGYRPDGKKWTTILLNEGYSYVEAGLVLVSAKRSLTANELVDIYMQDQKRSSNVMYPRFTRTGVNMYYSEKDGVYYYAQVFTLPVTSETQAVSKAKYRSVATANVNVRAGAGTGFDVVGSLGEGQLISVDSVSGKWTRILWNNSAYAYVSSSYLTPYSDTMISATARVNVRAGAGNGFKKLGQLKKGQYVVLLGFNGDWAEIVMNNGVTGYVHREYLDA